MELRMESGQWTLELLDDRRENTSKIRTLKLSNNSSEMVADQTRSKFARELHSWTIKLCDMLIVCIEYKNCTERWTWRWHKILIEFDLKAVDTSATIYRLFCRP